MPTGLRDAVEVARAALLDLHRVLLGAVRAEYERDRGPIGGPGELLRLVMEDELFAWLHPLSELVVALDDLLDTIPVVGEEDAAAARLELEQILSERGDPFRARYLSALQGGPEVILAHAALQRAAAALPQASAADAARLRGRRAEWAAQRAQRRPRS